MEQNEIKPGAVAWLSSKDFEMTNPLRVQLIGGRYVPGKFPDTEEIELTFSLDGGAVKRASLFSVEQTKLALKYKTFEQIIGRYALVTETEKVPGKKVRSWSF